MSLKRHTYTLVLETLRRLVTRLEAFGAVQGQQHRAAPHSADRPQRVLVTGAAGRVATFLRPSLRSAFPHVRLTDNRAVTDVTEREEFVLASLDDRDSIVAAMVGIDAVLHLGAASVETPFDELIAPNIIGVMTVLEAARAAGVRRVVLASSMHVLGLYSRFEALTTSSAPRSDSRYAVTKVFGEQMGRLFAEKWNMRVACVRIGHVMPERDEADPANWISPADLASIVQMALVHPDIQFEIFHAVSHYGGDDRGQAEMERRFGIQLSDAGSYGNALTYMEEYFRHDERARHFRGGSFASSEWEKS